MCLFEDKKGAAPRRESRLFLRCARTDTRSDEIPYAVCFEYGCPRGICRVLGEGAAIPHEAGTNVRNRRLSNSSSWQIRLHATSRIVSPTALLTLRSGEINSRPDSRSLVLRPESYFLRGRLTCLARATASSPSSTLRVTTDPAPIRVFFPSSTGATSAVLLPMKLPSPMTVRCL